jgi:type IV pilus assembly protein PilC
LKISRVPLKEKLFFLQHLGIMLKAGISLSQALKTLSIQSSNKYFQFVLLDLANLVDSGSSLTDSLKAHEKVFGELFINMIEAGEISGKLEQVLAQLYIQTKKSYELRSKVKGAMTYPAVILAAMGGIGTFMMIFVIPRITAMLTEFNTELPLPTKILIGTSSFLANNALLSGAVFIVAVGSFVQVLRTRRGKLIFQGVLLRLPIIGPIIKKINLAQFARTISSLMKTDIMIIKTFQITGNVLGNLYYRQALYDMSDKIKKGGKINDVVAAYPKLFPPLVSQMVMVGEETGELDNILEELADFYESEVDQIMSNLPSIIEPILILVLGAGVGGIAVAIIMPMYSITDSI